MSADEIGEAEVVLLLSSEAAKEFGYTVANMKDGRQLQYTCLCRSEDSIQEYNWRDKIIDLRGKTYYN